MSERRMTRRRMTMSKSNTMSERRMTRRRMTMS